jgi:hypothetical protein
MEMPELRRNKRPVILRSRAFARRLEGWKQAHVAHPSRLALKKGEHLRMTVLLGGAMVC